MDFYGFLQVISVLTLGGALGGFATFLIRRTTPSPAQEPSGVPEAPVPKRLPEWLANVIVGAIAALVVPVFLTVAQIGDASALINSLGASEASKVFPAILNLLGLSVLVGTIAPRFLSTLAERLLIENREKLEAIIAENRRQLEEMHAIKKGIEDAADREVPQRSDAAASARSLQQTDYAVMRGLADSDNIGVRRPTTRELARITGVEPTKVEETIMRLVALDLVAQSSESTPTESRWRLRKQGLKTLLSHPESR